MTNDITPTLLLIRVGAREDDLSYERGILKNCDLLENQMSSDGTSCNDNNGRINNCF